MIANALAIAALGCTLIFLLASLAVAAAVFWCLGVVLVTVALYEAWGLVRFGG